MTHDAIYIAGPMAGYELHNYPAFDHAAVVLRSHGFTVVNPAELNRAATVTPEDRRLFLRDDIWNIAQRCDKLFLLPSWHKSVGARLEVAIGIVLGFTFWEYDGTSHTGEDIVQVTPPHEVLVKPYGH